MLGVSMGVQSLSRTMPPTMDSIVATLVPDNVDRHALQMCFDFLHNALNAIIAECDVHPEDVTSPTLVEELRTLIATNERLRAEMMRFADNYESIVGAMRNSASVMMQGILKAERDKAATIARAEREAREMDADFAAKRARSRVVREASGRRG